MNAHAELTGDIEQTHAEKMANALNALYEIRLQLANLAVVFSQPTLLSVGLNLNLAEKHTCQAVEAIEQKHPELA